MRLRVCVCVCAYAHSRFCVARAGQASGRCACCPRPAVHVHNADHNAARGATQRSAPRARSLTPLARAQAEALSEPYEFLRAVTYNNLACYYRRQGKLRTSLKYLEKVTPLAARPHTNTRTCSLARALARVRLLQQGTTLIPNQRV